MQNNFANNQGTQGPNTDMGDFKNLQKVSSNMVRSKSRQSGNKIIESVNMMGREINSNSFLSSPRSSGIETTLKKKKNSSKTRTTVAQS